MAGFARAAPVVASAAAGVAGRARAAPALAQPRPPLALWAAGGLGRARALRWGPAGGVPPPAGGGVPSEHKSQGQDKRAYGAALTLALSGEDGRQGESPSGASLIKKLWEVRKNDRRSENPRNLRRMPIF